MTTSKSPKVSEAIGTIARADAPERQARLFCLAVALIKTNPAHASTTLAHLQTAAVSAGLNDAQVSAALMAATRLVGKQ